MFQPKLLIVEDEFILANDLASELASLGAQIVGFAPTADKALQLASSGRLRIDAAVLDIGLRGQVAYPAVRALLKRGVAVVFCTGIDRKDIPDEFHLIPCVDKPARPPEVMLALRREMQRTVGTAQHA